MAYHPCSQKTVTSAWCYQYTRVYSWPRFRPTSRVHFRITLPPACYFRLRPSAAGVFALIIAGERLTNILGSSARSTPLSPLDESNAAETQRTATAAAAEAVDWKERVAGCTGPADGFVFGGDPGRVLTFVRKGRAEAGGGGGGGGGGNGKVADGPALADVLRWFWELKHDRGVLSYEVTEELETRREVGSETGWEVVFTRNQGVLRVYVWDLRVLYVGASISSPRKRVLASRSARARKVLIGLDVWHVFSSLGTIAGGYFSAHALCVFCIFLLCTLFQP